MLDAANTRNGRFHHDGSIASGISRAITPSMKNSWLGPVLVAGLAACSTTNLNNGTGPDGGSPDGSAADDSIACAAATGFAATSVSPSAITLVWTATPGVTAALERKSYCGSDDYVQIASVGAGDATFTDSTVQAQWVYWYRLTTTDAHGGTAVLAIAADASTTNHPSCSGGGAPQASDAPATCTGDGGDGSGDGSGSGSGSGSASSDRATLDCTSSTQPAICAYLNATVTFKSPAASLSTACNHPTNVVAADPTNFASVMANVTAGQTVVFAAGTYQVANTLTLQSNVNYCGQSDPTSVVLQKASGTLFGGGDISNVVVAGLTFDGSSISTNSYTNVFIQNDVFRNDQQGWPYGQGVLVPTGSNLTIAANTFINNLGGIDAYDTQGLTVADNHFVNVPEGVAIEFVHNSSNTRVARNTFVEGRRIMIEMQNQDNTPNTNLVVEDNVILFPLQGGYSDTYGMGISAAIPASQGAVIRNNWLFGSVGNYQTIAVLALELAGTNLSVTGNTAQFWNQGTSFAYNGPTMELTSNSFCDVVSVLTQDGGFNGYPNTMSNNTCQMGTSGYAVPY